MLGIVVVPRHAIVVKKREQLVPIAFANAREGLELQNFCISATGVSMKATLTVTDRGVVSLPAKMRRASGIKADDLLIAETTPEGILLRPTITLPVEIYTQDRIREFESGEVALEKVLRRKSRR